VENFADLAWAAACFDLVTGGNVAKFGQQPAYREYLPGTGDEILVEASPRDQIWGIGLGTAAIVSCRAVTRATW
jgi:hypothetical protein